MKAKQFFQDAFLPKSETLTLRSAVRTETGWEIEAVGSDHAACPECGEVSYSRHSRYWRQLRDLPVQGIAVKVRLHLGRWRCRSRNCLRRIFVERISGVAVPYARQICRLGEIRVLVGRAVGGRPGQRLMSRLGMPTGRQTLLRQVTAAARQPSCAKPVRVLGVDDWAWNKGKSFGTILIDLERSVVTDLLPTRSAEALAAWLEKHPEVIVVSRDRQGSYAEGARRGAPQATQVADRFHLSLNLTQAVERELCTQRQHLQLASSKILDLQVTGPSNQINRAGRLVSIRSTVWQQEVEMGRQRRQENVELFETLKRMKAAGLKVNEMAKELGLNRRRLDRWLRFETLPERNRMHPRPGMSEAFREYLRKRWEAGCRHGRTLFAEVRDLGYVGCFSRLAAILAPWRQSSAESPTRLPQTPVVAETIALPGRRISPQVAAALLGKLGCDLTPRQREIVDRFKQHCPGYALMRKLVLSFRTILRAGKVATLHRWMERASKTGIHAFQRFVRTLKQDIGAVEAAVTEQWSNGPVEGHVNRLKTMKRQMYGRAGVELLRARLLPEPISAEHQL